jgi:bifunctional non-homologous end joining protein LigD
VSIPQFTPAELIRVREPFDSPEYIYELKMDGFRALADITNSRTRLVSRRGNSYKSFGRLCEAIGAELHCEATLDGEIVCLDAEGRPQFYELLRRRGHPVFYAFDLLALNGVDLRVRSLIERKRMLRSMVPKESSALLYASHIEQNGRDFFRLACDCDLEGIVAKWKHGAYGEGWYKIRNPRYSQYEGRRELFEKRAATSGR